MTSPIPQDTLAKLTGLIVKKPEDITAPAPTVAVTIERLSFFYGLKQALFDISLPLHQNAITAIIGPSGCGKSTLLRTINRIYDLYPEQRASGHIYFQGRDLFAEDTDVNRVRQDIGMVFQKPTPFPMSIFDNVAYGIRLHKKLTKADLDLRVEKALRQAALWDEVKDILRHSGLSLSGGQQQRLCIARALAVEPKVLLLDEPTSALDPVATDKIEKLVADLKKNYTIAIVTHNMQQAARLSDMTAFMYLGKLIEFGSTSKIFKNPDTKQTKDYVMGRFG